ncbi:hypothetical protein RhoFasSB10_04381 [Rhodococcus fascians]|nr:hypothetical protein [Rhodococcus fascians]
MHAPNQGSGPTPSAPGSWRSIFSTEPPGIFPVSARTGRRDPVRNPPPVRRRGRSARTSRDPPLVDEIKLSVETARQRCRAWAHEVLERRASAILLRGFAGAYRCSELSRWACGDCTVHRHDGLHIRLRKAKTKKVSRGRIKLCGTASLTRPARPAPTSASRGRVRGRPSVIRPLRNREPFDCHVCCGAVPRTAVRAPLYRAIRACSVTQQIRNCADGLSVAMKKYPLVARSRSPLVAN